MESPPCDLETRSLKVLKEAVDAFGDEGERRSQQEEMTAAVARAIAENVHLAVKAGTGTGKSLAYLIPAVLSGRRTVVATATKALQDQLTKKELPFLSNLLPPCFGEKQDRPLRWSVLKGRSNYLCRQRLEEEIANKLPLDDYYMSQDDLQAFVKWSKNTRTGDRSELPLAMPGKGWERFSVSSRQCPGKSRCWHGEQCFTELSRSQARQADVVIVNAALLATSLMGSEVIPIPEVFVIDEAHGFANVVSNIAGASVNRSSFEDAARALEALKSSDGTPLRNSGERLAELLQEHAGQSLQPEDAPDLTEALVLAGERLTEAQQSLMDNQTMELLFDTDSDKRSGEAQRQRAIVNIGTLREEINRILNPPDGYVVFIEQTARSLRLAPLDVSELLADNLYKSATVILTSGTLPESVPANLGLGEVGHEYLDVGSPFDYQRAGLLYCAAHLPDPRSDSDLRNAALAEEIADLIEAAGGRTLVLFTSWRVLEVVYEKLEGRLRWPLLRQETSQGTSAAELLKEFSENPEACLFATMSFWQGVDVPGHSLSLVVLDKLPFPNMSDPLLRARRTRAGDEAFKLVDLPHCALLLAQGAGRLIRTSEDKGVVAILDPRLAKANYREEILEQVPSFKRTITKNEVLDFLGGLRQKTP